MKGGGPAFPSPGGAIGGRLQEGHPGMELRDWFAGQVIAGWGETYHGLAFNLRQQTNAAEPFRSPGDYGPAEIATVAYQIADALVSERSLWREPK